MGFVPQIESSEQIIATRERQYRRYGREICNGKVPFEQLISNSPFTYQQQEYLQTIAIKQGLSNRVQIIIIRLARTIADLREEDSISNEDLKEVFSYGKMTISRNSLRVGE